MHERNASRDATDSVESQHAHGDVSHQDRAGRNRMHVFGERNLLAWLHCMVNGHIKIGLPLHQRMVFFLTVVRLALHLHLSLANIRAPKQGSGAVHRTAAVLGEHLPDGRSGALPGALHRTAAVLGEHLPDARAGVAPEQGLGASMSSDGVSTAIGRTPYHGGGMSVMSSKMEIEECPNTISFIATLEGRDSSLEAGVFCLKVAHSGSRPVSLNG
eukprot:s3224_g4.t1